MSAAAYVLQLAAHSSQASAEKGLAALDAPGAEVIKTWSSEGDVFVIIAGSYPDYSAAEAAANNFAEHNAGATFWIRSTANFLKAL